MVGDGYQIVHDSSFDRELRELSGTMDFGEDLIHGICSLLNRNPHCGRSCSKSVYFLSNANEDAGRFNVYYTIDEVKKEVGLLSIKRFDLPESNVPF